MKQKQKTYPALWRLCAAAIIGAGPLAANAAVPAFQPMGKAEQQFNAQTDRLIVKYKDSSVNKMGGISAPALGADRLGIVQRAGQQFGLNMKMLHATGTGAHVVQLDRRMNLDEVAAVARELKERDPSIEYAEPDRILQALASATDPRYSEQWHYFEATGGLRLPAAWDLANGGGVNVAVIDTGYRPHADLISQILPGYDFVSNTFMANDGGGRDADAQDPGDAIAAGACGNGKPVTSRNSSWHGTHVAGTVAARTNNTLGGAGVAFNARIVPVRVLGRCGGYTSDIADGIVWASGGVVANVTNNPNRAKVLNLSLGGPGACDSTTQAAINGARSRGSVVVVAAGNDNTDASGFNPANCAGVITVAATDRNGGRAWYSNFGSIVDVAAPGGDTSISNNGILSTHNTGASAPGSDSYAFMQGTSMAAPHVAGVAALMFARNPGLKPDDLEARLKGTTRSFPAACSGCGTGIVDAGRATFEAGVIVDSYFETEPNNTTGAATIVNGSGMNLLANLSTSTDTDYFVVQLPPGRTLTAVMTPSSGSTYDYDLYAYNNTGTQIAMSEKGVGVADSVSMTNTGTTTVARYVRVKYYSGPTGSTNGNYQIKFTW